MMARPLRLSIAFAGFVVLSGCHRAEPPPQPPSAPPAPVHRISTPLDVAEVVFDGKLGIGWEDFGWGPHEYVAGQPARIGFGGYGGWILHHADLTPRFGGLSFRFRAPPGFGDFLEVSLQYRQVDEKALPPVAVEAKDIALLPDGWSEVFIPWERLNPNGSPFDRIQIRASRDVPADLVAIDKIVLTKSAVGTGAVVKTRAPDRTLKLAVQCDKPAQPINPLVYGFAADEWDTFASARRIGGNTLTRMNFDTGTWNTGSDWFFENVGGNFNMFDSVDALAKRNVPVALVVPTIGWVAKDSSSVGFPISKLGPQRNHDQWRPDAGDGYAGDGKPIAPGSPTETSMPASPELIAQWVGKFRERDRVRGRRVIGMYILDNEPNLWSVTHRDVHPEPLTYDELLERTIKYGTAVRKADPDAVIAGPAEWGWSGYFYSAKDLAPGSVPHADQMKHGGVPLLPWYLRKLAEYEKRTKVHILDVVDVHFYPQAPDVLGGTPRTDPAGAALRIRSTRALWDPTYVDESWIGDRIQLIPRLKQWIAENYPGRGISIGEWSFGAEEHISGGLAIAETLGRFGQQGITSAFYWLGPKAGTPGSVAFRAYRNYDGQGAQFLPLSVPTVEAPGLSLFASRDEAGTHLTAVVLNLDPNAVVQADVDVSQCGTASGGRAFTYDGSGPALAPGTPPSIGAGVVSVVLPPYSMQVLELSVAKR